MNPSLSIVLATHNRPNLLARALQSLCSQEFDDFEIILCADEGLKETKEVALKYLRPTDSFVCAPRIRGPAGTRNLGISMASGRHVCFLEGQENVKVDIGGFPIERLMVCNFIPNNALFVPTTIAQKYPFDVRLQSHEDWDWLLILYSHGYVFKHHSFFGPNVHIGGISSRNNNAKNSKSIGLDFLSIYRKWPAQSEDLKIARSEMLKVFEMGAPTRFL